MKNSRDPDDPAPPMDSLENVNTPFGPEPAESRLAGYQSESPRRSRPPSDRHPRRGAAAIEFGIILPLFITIVLGCVDFGRFAHSYIAVSHAARAGAGHGMMKRVTAATMANWQNEIRQAVQDEMAHVMASDTLDVTDLQVTATHATDPNGLWRVRVVVVYPFETVVAWPVLPGRVDMRRAVEMRGIR
jgi:hypothetical protein